MFLVYNLDVLSENDFQLSVNDRAFQYGDGLFETIRYEQGKLWFWPDHFARLSAGMAALQLSLPSQFTAEALYQSIFQLLAANQLTNQTARIKIQVWRQTGGLYTPTTNEAHVLITTRSGNTFAVTEKAAIGIHPDVRLAYSPISAFKTLNALPYILAGLYKAQQQLDDVILLDQDGNFGECMASNLFWYANKALFTPSLQTGCINGIARRQLLRLASVAGISVHEGLYQPDALQEAETLFCANAMGIQWFRQVFDDQLNTHPTLFSKPNELLNSLFAQFCS
jgi:branched-chain amino acid aminotransferase/4-amino-4-deoxychorismate lyase